MKWPGSLAEYQAGSTEPWAASVLHALARLARPRHILELGTFEGRTTRLLASVAPTTTVDVRERHDGNLGGALFVEADAIAFLEACTARYDFVFVDDDHTRAHVERELELLASVVEPGGLIVLHDVVGPFGLGSLVEERGGFIIELPLLHVAGGLGVIPC